MDAKYKLDDTVITLNWWVDPARLGIVKGIHITKERIAYEVRVSPTTIYHFKEKELVPSKTRIHKDGYQVKKGQKIVVDRENYIVQEAEEKYFFVETVQDCPVGNEAYIVEAKSADGKLKTFEQVGINEFRDLESEYL